MTVEEALLAVERVLDRGYLNTIEEIVFRQVWEGRSYLQISQSSGYDYGYIKDTGYRLWRLLSAAYGEKVTKHNMKSIVQRSSPRSSLQILPSLQVTLDFSTHPGRTIKRPSVC
jgi:hypothetical protein